jgi:protein-S-isoprenylcysteine O-methyltransferase Ste14
MSDPDDNPRRTAAVRGLVLLVCIGVLAGSFAVLFNSSGGLTWLAGFVAAAAALATLAAAVRLLAALSLLFEPRDRR